MPRIIVEALHTNGEPRRWTLSERVLTANLASDHYVYQLLERLTWATADAEGLEALALEPPSAQLEPVTARRSRLRSPRVSSVSN